MTSLRQSSLGDAPAADSSGNGQVAGRYALDGYTVVWAHGEIDLATAPALMQELACAVRTQQCRVIVDLTQVSFMDSTGLNALVLARRKAETSSGELRLVGACPLIRKVLRITGLERVFPLYSTIEESIGQESPVPHIATLVQLPMQTEPPD